MSTSEVPNTETLAAESGPADTESGPISEGLLNEVMAQLSGADIEIGGPEGALALLNQAVIGRVLDDELTEHLGYEKGDPAGNGSGNSRNGTFDKTVLSETGELDLKIPRDRNGTFEPKVVPHGQRRLAGFDQAVLSLYAGGMTTRDIRRHLAGVYGVEISAGLVSRVTDSILDELDDWQNRPLESCYPILYIDALVIKVRDSGTVINKAAYVAVGVDAEGRKHVLGIWIGDGAEGAKWWLTVLTELGHRGMTDVLIVCCDGLKGLPDAIETIWPKALVQTCVIHLMRASFRYATYTDRRKISAGLREIYTAINEQEARTALDAFNTEWGNRYPAIVKVWEDAWEQFTPFLRFPPLLRKIIYTTNMVESVNYQLRKVTKNRGHFPTDTSALKLLRLAARDITTTRSGTAGTGTQHWQLVLNILEIHFPDRLPRP